MSMKVRIRLWVKIVLFLIIFLLLIFIYGRFIDTKGFKVNEYTIKANIPDSFNGLKIVHISDINYLHTTNKNNLEKIVDRINLINPDIVVFTGDLFNKDINYTDEDITNITNILTSIRSNLGKFAVYGEEDKLFDEVDEILSDSDFTILDNSYEYVYNKTNEPIVIAGINDDKDIDYVKSTYSILLLHKPDYVDDIDYSNYDLILSGHSIGGYVNIPFIKKIFLEKGSTNYFNDYYKLDNTKLYISSGIGTKNIRFRMFNMPSINFYRINKK